MHGPFTYICIGNFNNGDHTDNGYPAKTNSGPDFFVLNYNFEYLLSLVKIKTYHTKSIENNVTFRNIKTCTRILKIILFCAAIMKYFNCYYYGACNMDVLNKLLLYFSIKN